MFDAVDAESNQASDAITLENIYTFAIQAVFTGSPNGALSIEGSCDQGKNPVNASSDGAGIVNWTQVANTSVTTSGTVMMNVVGAGYKWMRLVWTDSSSSTSTITARVNSKGA